MADLSVKYLGLQLKNPIIVASSGLTNSVEKVVELERNGAGAVVLKSLFEEQIFSEAQFNVSRDQSFSADVHDYILNYTKQNSIENYINLIKGAKSAVSIPVIASINCVTDSNWIEFAKSLQDAGADAIEVNLAILPSDHEKSGADYEKIYFSLTEKLRSTLKLPIALKISDYSSGLSNLIKTISWTGNIDSIVMFNRFYNPDIDIDNFKITSSNVFSDSHDYSNTLRWVAIMRNCLEIDICATTGIHDGKAVIKQLLVGADAVQIASVIYKNGPVIISKILSDIELWMDNKKFKSISDFKGKMAFKKGADNTAFERIQFMKHFGGIE